MTHGRAAVASLWLAWAVCGVLLDASVQQKPEPKPSAVTLEGEYRCEGRTEMLVQGRPQMVDYALKLVIETADDVYHLLWSDQRGPTQKGFGFTRDGQLVVVMWGASGAVGVASYKIAPEGLLGLWSGGSGAVEREDCKRGGAKA